MGKPADPDVYVAAIVAVLAEYPPEIVARVCDPVHGIARKCKFLPTIKELGDELENEMGPLRRAWREGHERKQRALDREARARALPDAQAEQRIVSGLQKLSEVLAAAPDPVPPKRIGHEPVMPPVSGHAARVFADIVAKRKQPKGEA